MPLDFPDSPTVGQVYLQWYWSGSAWEINAAVAAGSPNYQVGPGLRLDASTLPATIDVATPYLPLAGGGTVTGSITVTNHINVNDYLRAGVSIRLTDAFFPATQEWALYAVQGDLYLWNNNNNKIAMKSNWSTGIVTFPSGVISQAWIFNDQNFVTQQWRWTAYQGFSYLAYNNPNDPQGWAIGVQYDNGSVYIHHDFFVYGSFSLQTLRIPDSTQGGQYWELYATGGKLRLRSDNYADWMTIDHTTGVLLSVSGFHTNSNFTFYDPYYSGLSRWFTWWASQGTAYFTSNYQGGGATGFGATVLFSVDWLGGLLHFPSGAESKGGFYVTDQLNDGGNPPTNPRPFQQWRWYANAGATYLYGGPDWGWSVEWLTGNVTIQHNLFVNQSLGVQGIVTSRGYTFLDQTIANWWWQWYAKDGYARFRSDNAEWITISHSTGVLLSSSGIHTNSNFTFFDPYYAGMVRWFTWWASQGTAYFTSNYQGGGAGGFGATILFSVDWLGGLVHFPSGAESRAGFYVTDQLFGAQQWRWYAYGGFTYLGLGGGPDWSWGVEWNTGTVYIQHFLQCQQSLGVQGTGTSRGWLFLDTTNANYSWKLYAQGGFARLYSSNYGGDYITIDQNGGTLLALGGIRTGSHFMFYDPFYSGLARSFSIWASQGTGYITSNYGGQGVGGFGTTIIFSFDWLGGTVHFPSGAESKGGFYVTDQLNDGGNPPTNPRPFQQWRWYANAGFTYLAGGPDWGWGIEWNTGNVFIQHFLQCQQSLGVQGDVSGRSYTFRDTSNPSHWWKWYSTADLARITSDIGTDLVTLSRLGELVVGGGVTTGIKFEFWDAAYSGHRWIWSAAFDTASLWANTGNSPGFYVMKADYNTGIVNFPQGVISAGGWYWSDQVLTTQQWHLWAHGGETYIDSSNPDIPNGRPTHPVFSANWTSGLVTIPYGLNAGSLGSSSTITATSDITSYSGFFFRDRTNINLIYGWYATGGLAYFWTDNASNRLSIDRASGKMFVYGTVETGGGFQFDDPFYGGHQWMWWASQDTAHLWNNFNSVAGGTDCILINYTTGVVTFPRGVNLPGGLLWTDDIFTSQQWKLYAHGGFSYIWSNGVGTNSIGFDYLTGHTYVLRGLFCYDFLSLTQPLSRINFANGAAYQTVDSTNFIFHLGSGNGGWYFQNSVGGNVAYFLSSGALACASVSAGALSSSGGVFTNSSLNVGLRCLSPSGGSNLYIFDDNNSHVEGTVALWLNGNTRVPTYVGGALVVNGLLAASGGLSISGSLTVPGEIWANGATGMLSVDNRNDSHAPHVKFGWYASDELFHCWSNYDINLFDITRSGEIILRNLSRILGRDTGGTPRWLIGCWNNNEIYVSETDRPLHLRGNTIYMEGGQTFSTSFANYYQGYNFKDRNNWNYDFLIYADNRTMHLMCMGYNVIDIRLDDYIYFYRQVKGSAYRWLDAQYTNQEWVLYSSGGWGRLFTSNVGDAIQINWGNGLVQFPFGVTSPGGWYFNDQTFGHVWRLWSHDNGAYLDSTEIGYAIAVQHDNLTVFIHRTLQCQQDLGVNWNISQVGSYHLMGGGSLSTGDVNTAAGPLIYMDGNWGIFKTGTGNQGFIFRNYWAGEFGRISSAGELWLNGTKHSQGDGGFCRIAAPNGIWAIECGWSISYYTTNQHYFRSDGRQNYMYIGSDSFQVYNGNAYKYGGGMWYDNSDVRLKDEIADYRTSLDELLQLRPVTYKFNGRGGSPRGGKTFIGLVADEVLKAMPEMVGTRRARLDPEDDEDVDILTLDMTALPLALLNAVRELNQRLSRLEGLLQP